MSDVLSLHEICISIHKKKILENITFNMTRGQSVAIVGHNGAGKTTLFHLILSLKFATRGSIKLFGLESDNPIARKSLGFVPERPFLNLDLSLRRLLSYMGELSGIKGETLNQKIDQVANEVELSPVLDQKLATFSKGMLQKALIAQAMLHDPSLLILDEPMSGLDPGAREFFKLRLKKWKSENKSILFSSHVLEDVKEIADIVGVIDSGRLTFFGPVSDWVRGGS